MRFDQKKPSGLSTMTSPTSSSQDGKGRCFNLARRETRVRTGRIVFILCLAIVATVLGVVAYLLLADAEEKLAQEQFDSISERALDASVGITLRQRDGLITMASMAEQTFPDAETWPFVNFKGFQEISSNLIKTSSGQPLGLLPLVTPEQLADFEDFGNSLFPDAPFDRVTGLDANQVRYNETDGETYWGSPYKIFTPFLFHTYGPILFMANLHAVEDHGKIIDKMVSCAAKRSLDMRQNADREDFVPMECSILTDIQNLIPTAPNPGAVAYQPIYPPNDPTELTGFLFAAITWEDILLDIFPSEISGVDCVLETEPQVFTYEIVRGVAYLKGEGDLHDTEFSDYGQSVALNDRGLYSTSSALYHLSVYPRREFFETYSTNNPTIATVGAICIIIFTSAMFVMYDFFVRQEFRDKDVLFKAKRQFVRFISHEVRTPLNAVCMGLQLLKDEVLRLSQDIRQVDETIEKKTPLSSTSAATSLAGSSLQDRATELSDLTQDILVSAYSAVDVLNDILNFDKVESGTLRLELTVVQIWDLIEQITAEFRQQAHAKNIKYVLDFGDDEDQENGHISSASELPQDVKKRNVVGDSARIGQVLRNLISNALKFTPEKGETIIRVVCKKSTAKITQSKFTLDSGEAVEFTNSGLLQLQVCDTGAGMTETQLQNVFREGVQFNANKLQEGQGSGLGMYIAKSIIQQHEGSLEAASQGIGCGTTFTMTIPLYFVPDVHPPESAQQLRETGDVMRIESLSVLIVDDSYASRRLLRRLLENQGHVCVEAEDGVAAVQRVKEASKEGKHFDSILMDYQMTEMDGPKATQEIRAMGCDSLIVGVTGNMFPEEVAHFKECGANSVLPKPLDLNALLDLWVEHGIGSPM